MNRYDRYDRTATDWQYHAGTRIMRRRDHSGCMPQMMHLKEYHTRWWAMEHLSRNGRFRSIVSHKMHETIYRELADGFGRVTPPHYDWSHIRDSSPAAWRRIANYLTHLWIYPDFDAVYASLLANIEMLNDDMPGYTPLEYYNLWERDEELTLDDLTD